MRILVNGACGRMGPTLCRMIEDSAQHTVSAAVDPRGDGVKILRDFDHAPESDVLIDFSHHSAVSALLDYAVAVKLPVLIATTGHTPEELECIRRASEQIPVFYSGNMSVGIALLCSLAKKAATVFPEADIEIVETHHRHKLDAPSGTALMLAEAVRDARPGASLNVGRQGQGLRPKDEIGIHSLRMGSVVGEHEVRLATGSQILTLKHQAQDRSLFAEGALAAASFLAGQAPGLYQMRDMVKGE